MSRVFRQQYTRAIPDDAQHTTIKNKKGEQVPAVRFKGPDGKMITAPVTTKGKYAGKHCRVKSPTYSGRVNGVVVPLCTNKEASEVMLADLVRNAARREAGMVDLFEAHHKRPLAEHLADFRLHLEAKGDDPRHVRQTIAFVEALTDGCGFVRLADLDLAKAQAWLASLREDRPAAELEDGKDEWAPGEVARLLGVTLQTLWATARRHGLDAEGNGKARRYPRAAVQTLAERAGRGVSIETVNHYVRAVRSFCRWLVKPPVPRLPFNPLDGLEVLNADVDRRRNRRELEAGQVGGLLATVRTSNRNFRGLTGDARFHLYATAYGTGLRAAALASLIPESFDRSTGSNPKK